MSQKIYPALTMLDSHVFVVAFKAEYNISEDALKNSAFKIIKENLDIVVANDVSLNKFGSNKSNVFLITRKKIKHLKGSKTLIAKKIFDLISEMNVRRG